jgi:hypothetical protein
MDLRCAGRKHGELHDGIVEFKCNFGKCGSRKGVVVIHRFDTFTGEMLETLRFAEPPEGGTRQDGTQQSSASIRTS